MSILAESTDYLVVDKPAGLPVIPARHDATCLLHVLAEQIGLPASGEADPRLRIVHRLDSGTSGVLLLAKTLSAQRWFTQQFEIGAVRKEYLALVAGRAGAEQGVIDAPIGPHPRQVGMMTILADGKPAVTRWRVEERLDTFTLLRAMPESGRTHQIRVHLRSIGLPLAVDPVYNAPPKGRPVGLFLSSIKGRGYRKADEQEERPLIGRLTLHAERLSLTTPAGHAESFVAPLPRDFRATLAQLRKLVRRTG